MFPHSITKNAMLPRNSQVPQRSSLFLSEKNSPHDSLTRRSSDPPDHMEERALRKLYSQHQVSPKPWNQSITSPPEHSLKKHDRANHCNDSQRRPSSSKSVSPIRNDTIESYESSSFSASCREAGFAGTSKDKKKHTRRIPRIRHMSPHPVDVMKVSAAAAADATELQQKDRRILGSPAPNFTFDGTLGSSESAEELRRLIEAMETEFRRLRQSKLQAEAKATKLETELFIQQQMMKRGFESLNVENEQLKSALSVSQTKLACVMEKLNQSAASTAGVIPKKCSRSHATEGVHKKSVDEGA